jgi:hypothetical protein
MVAVVAVVVIVMVVVVVVVVVVVFSSSSEMFLHRLQAREVTATGTISGAMNKDI